MKNPPAVQEVQQTCVQSLCWEDPLDEGMETHSSILALGNPIDREAWRATVHGAASSQIRLKPLSTSTRRFYLMEKKIFLRYKMLILGINIQILRERGIWVPGGLFLSKIPIPGIGILEIGSLRSKRVSEFLNQNQIMKYKIIRKPKVSPVAVVIPQHTPKDRPHCQPPPASPAHV